MPGAIPGLKRTSRAADTKRVHRFRLRLGWFELTAAALLVATALDGVYTGHGWHNSDFVLYTATGKTMLSGAWVHTFHDPRVQAAPFELLSARALHWMAGPSHVALAIATETILCAALILTFRSVVGRRSIPLVFFIAAVIALGPIPDAYATGHYAEPVAGILWLLAARYARAGRVELAGLLIGISAGFELWGVLGITVLALAPSLRRAVRGVVIAAAIPVLMLAPFMLAGDFHMFSFHWYVEGGPIHVILGGRSFGWPLAAAPGRHDRRPRRRARAPDPQEPRVDPDHPGGDDVRPAPARSARDVLLLGSRDPARRARRGLRIRAARAAAGVGGVPRRADRRKPDLAGAYALRQRPKTRPPRVKPSPKVPRAKPPIATAFRHVERRCQRPSTSCSSVVSVSPRRCLRSAPPARSPR